MFNLQPLTKQILIICACVLGVAFSCGLFYVLATGSLSVDDIVKMIEAWGNVKGVK